MPVFFSVLAESDLEDIGDYIAADNPVHALSFIGEIRKHCEKIGRTPRTYRLRLELGAAIRSCAHGHYLILFTIIDADARSDAESKREPRVFGCLLNSRIQ